MSKSSILAELERMIAQDNVEHHYPKDSTERIHGVVIGLVFLSIMFLLMIFAFLFAVKTEGPTMQTYAVLQIKPIDTSFISGISQGISDFVTMVSHSSDRPIILLTFYVFWIVIVGLANLIHFERKAR
jgi:hypothetical protein